MRLTKAALLAGVVPALAAGGFALAGTTGVSMTSAGPQPATVTVSWGDTLQVKNEDTVPHQFVSSHGELQTGTLLPGSTYTTTFTTKTRSYGYRQTGGRGYPGQVVISFDGRVSLKSPATVPFGSMLSLRGTSSIADTPVQVEIRRTGDPQWQLLASQTSGGNGRYSVSLRLARGGKLRAAIAAGEIHSAPVNVAVRPRIQVGRGSGGVRARLTPAGSATRVTLECRAGPGHWKRVGAARPDATGKAFLRTRRGKRTVVRVTVLHRDAAKGFASLTSRPLALSAAC